SAKENAYGLMPGFYLYTHAPIGSGYREFLLEVVQRPFLSDILPKLLADDRRELSRAVALLLAEAVPLNGQAEDFFRPERLVPPGFETHFYYHVGEMAMDQHPNALQTASAVVEVVRHRSSTTHHLSPVRIYRTGLW